MTADRDRSVPEERWRQKSPRIAAILSFWYPGLGQLYGAAWVKGLLTVAAIMLLAYLLVAEVPVETVLNGELPRRPGRVLAICVALVGIWVWSIWDAARSLR